MSFETKWHMKTVRKRDGYWQIPSGEYVVTAALENFDSDGASVFAVSGPGGWFTIHVAPEDLPKLDQDFEVLVGLPLEAASGRPEGGE
jgi:hypothetical protein